MIRKPKFRLNWKYALGEVVLIFLGISLALAFQTWNEQRKNKIERDRILKNLQFELKKDSTAYEEILGLLEDRELRIQRILNYLETPPSSLDSAQFIISLMRAGYITSYVPNFSVYKELIGSGKLTLIESGEVKLALADFMSSVDREIRLGDNYYPFSKELEKLALSHLSKVPEVIGYINTPPPSYRKIRFDLFEMSKDEELRSALLMSLYSTRVERTFQSGEVLVKLTSLLQLLNHTIQK